MLEFLTNLFIQCGEKELSQTNIEAICTDAAKSNEHAKLVLEAYHAMLCENGLRPGESTTK